MSSAIAAIGSREHVLSLAIAGADRPALLTCCVTRIDRQPDGLLHRPCMARIGKAKDHPCGSVAPRLNPLMCVRSSIAIATRERSDVRNNLLTHAVVGVLSKARLMAKGGFLPDSLDAGAKIRTAFTIAGEIVDAEIPEHVLDAAFAGGRHVTDNVEMVTSGRHCDRPDHSGPSWKIPLEDAFPYPCGLIAFSSHRAATRKFISTGRYP
jgi:hypothetical protein